MSNEDYLPAYLKRVGNGMEESLPTDERVLVVGGGPAGLAVTHCLEQAGLGVRTVERSDQPAAAWRDHYDSLQLFSPRRLSSLPGRLMPKTDGIFPTRDTIVDYLLSYEKALKTNLEYGVEVTRIDRHYGGWRVETTKGTTWHPAVVVATGLQRDPKEPVFPGSDSYAGELVHARGFRNGEPYRGKEALIVGAGISGTDIAKDLVEHGAARVRVAVRTPPLVLPVAAGGLSWLGHMLKHSPLPEGLLDRMTKVTLHKVLARNAKQLRIPAPTYGVWEAFSGKGGTLNFDRGGIAAIKRGDFGLVSALDRFDGCEAVLADGTRLRPDVVIIAAGQRPGLEPMVGHLGTLNKFGRPVAHGAETARGAPRLFFVGFRVPPAQLADIRFDAKRIAKRLKRDMGTGATWRLAPRPMSNPAEPVYPPEPEKRYDRGDGDALEGGRVHRAGEVA
jgi:cation diffusion facilitator CzcD-associated flavoprotein CzcO